MSNALDLSTKETYQLVSFVYGGGSNFYTDWTSDVVFDGDTYVSTPDMEVMLPTNDGLFSEKDCRVALPLSSSLTDFTQVISNGQPHTPVECTVREVIKATTPGPAQSVHTLFIGTVDVSRRNYRGRQDKILLQSLPDKATVETVSMGVPCTHLCDNRLGDSSCKIDLSINNRVINVTVASINGRQMTIAANATVAAKPDRTFHRGYAKLNGLFIGIRDWRSSAPTVFNLVRQPPDSWIGSTLVEVVSGCDQSVETCRSRWNNEDNFNGAGYAIPPYHPNWENAP